MNNTLNGAAPQLSIFRAKDGLAAHALRLSKPLRVGFKRLAAIGIATHPLKIMSCVIF